MNERILRAKLLFTGDGSVIHNGMIRVDDHGQILELAQEIKGDNIEDFEAICPGLINAHCHLELSHLHGKVPKHQGLHEFIPSLQSQREVEISEIEEQIEKWDEKMYAQGIVAVGDISNSNHSISRKQQSKIHYHSFIELFGLRKHKAVKIMERGMDLKEQFESNGLSASLSPHSPYSVSTDLFQLINEQEKNGPLSIHNQESEGEILLFGESKGPLKEMLLNFGNTEDSMEFQSTSSLDHILGFLDQKLPLQLVHNTYTTKTDIELAENKHPSLFWCFCPSANWYIEKRLPNIPLFVQEKVKCTLGTDSLASNEELSILEEMKLIQKHYPSIKTEEMIKWASKNGAEFLGLKEMGEIKVGSKPGLNKLSSLEETGHLKEISSISSIF